MITPIDKLRRWMGRTLDWCTIPNRPWWHLFYIVPVLIFLLTLSRIIGKVNDDNTLENPQ